MDAVLTKNSSHVARRASQLVLIDNMEIVVPIVNLDVIVKRVILEKVIMALV